MAFNAELTTEMEKAFAKKVQEVERKIVALKKEIADKYSESAEHLLEKHILQFTPIGANAPDREKRIKEAEAKRDKSLREHATAHNDLSQAKGTLEILNAAKDRIVNGLN
jgi:hypothetical protein